MGMFANTIQAKFDEAIEKAKKERKLKMQKHNFTIVFVDALDPDFALEYNLTIEDYPYEVARRMALEEGQNIVRGCDDTRCLFMRLMKA